MNSEDRFRVWGEIGAVVWDVSPCEYIGDWECDCVIFFEVFEFFFVSFFLDFSYCVFVFSDGVGVIRNFIFGIVVS